jgi:hypothetical protein
MADEVQEDVQEPATTPDKPEPDDKLRGRVDRLSTDLGRAVKKLDELTPLAEWALEQKRKADEDAQAQANKQQAEADAGRSVEERIAAMVDQRLSDSEARIKGEFEARERARKDGERRAALIAASGSPVPDVLAEMLASVPIDQVGAKLDELKEKAPGLFLSPTQFVYPASSPGGSPGAPPLGRRHTADPEKAAVEIRAIPLAGSAEERMAKVLAIASGKR